MIRHLFFLAIFIAIKVNREKTQKKKKSKANKLTLKLSQFHNFISFFFCIIVCMGAAAAGTGLSWTSVS